MPAREHPAVRPPAASEMRKSQLSPARHRLVELMQSVNFGRIEGLLIRAGQPVLDGPDAPRVVREVKFGGENGRRPEAGGAADFALKAEVSDLMAHLDQLGDARVEVLAVKHGVPFAMHVEARG